MSDLLRDADSIWPLLQKKVAAMIAAASVGTGGTSGAIGEHDLGGNLHKGVLRDDQGPQFLLSDGSRMLVGNLAVDAGVTIDGIDISAHAADPNAHHAKQHSILSTGDHTVTGSQWQVVGLAGANTLGLLTPSSAPGAAEALLKSDATGQLALPIVTASTRVRTPLVDTASGSLTLTPAADLVLDPGSGLTRLASGDHIQSDNYASQTTGWRVTYQGEADFRYLFVDEMHAKSFIADLEQALAGGQIISKSVAMLAQPFTAPAAATLAPTFRAKNTVTTQSTTVTLTKPTGTTAGDLLIVHIAGRSTRTVSSAPSGWTLLAQQTGGSTSSVWVYWKLAGSSEPASYAWTFNSADDYAGCIQAFYNVDQTTPIDTYAGQGGTSTTAVTAPSITTSITNTRLLFFAGFLDANITGANATPPSGFTEQADVTSPSYAWIYAADVGQVGIGGTGAKTATLASAHQYAAVLVALRPAATTIMPLTVRDLPSAPNMAVFQDNDYIRLRQFSRAGGGLTIADCWGQVVGYIDNPDGTQSWTFTRSAAPNAGGMAVGNIVQPDAIVLDYGTDGNGFAETNAIDGLYGANSPYLQFVTWTGHPATGQKTRVRLGHLRGITGVAGEFGLLAGTGFTTADSYIRASSQGVEAVNTPISLYRSGVKEISITPAYGLDFRAVAGYVNGVSWSDVAGSGSPLASLEFFIGTTSKGLMAWADPNSSSLYGQVVINCANSQYPGGSSEIGMLSRGYGVAQSSIDLYADLVRVNNYGIYHAGNLSPAVLNTSNYFNGAQHITADGNGLNLYGTSAEYIQFYPRGLVNGRKAWLGFGTAWPTTGYSSFGVINEDTGNLYLGTNNTVFLTITNDGRTLLNGAVGTAGEALTVNGIMGLRSTNGYLQMGPQNTSYCHYFTDRGSHWFNTSLVVNGALSSYSQDFSIQRNGVAGVTLYSWGTQVRAHLTIDDVFALLNVQGSEPIAPTTGAKLFLINESSHNRLKVKFANGTVVLLASD